MDPYHNHFLGDDFNLTSDDIRGVQSIYGGKRVTSPPPTLPPRTSIQPVVRFTDTIGAAYLGDDRELNVFNRNKHYVLNNAVGGVERGPLPVDNHFGSLTNVDTVFRRHGDRSLVFYGNKFNVYNHNKRLVDKGREIKNGFQNIDQDVVENLDAAFLWPYNSKLYLW